MANIGMAAGELGHRIGNKLGLVRMHVDEIREQIGSAYPDVHRRLELIQMNVQYLLSLTQKLRKELSDPFGGLEKPKQVFLAGVILSEARSLRTLPETVQVVIDLPTTEPEVYVNDGIFDAFINIYTNAVEVLEQRGFGTVTMRAHQVSDWVEFEIEDDGPGIEDSNRDKIFQLFYSTKKDGMGFGLFSAKQRILINGGYIDVQSQPGAGAKFIIRLPAALNKGRPS